MSTGNGARADLAKKSQQPAKPTVTPDGAQAESYVPAQRILALQKIIGNQAVQKMGIRPTVSVTHRMTVQRVQRATGLADTSNVDDYAKSAVAFCRDDSNADKPLTDLGDHLMKKVNELLKAIPSHECAHSFRSGGTSGAFASGTFQIYISTSAFSERSGITKIGQLTEAEIAEVVDTVYHEARHSEQYFRAARVMAGEGKKAEDIVRLAAIPNAVALEAIKSPIANNTENAAQVGEVNKWRDFIGKGKYVDYKWKVGDLRDAIAPAREKLNADDRPGFDTKFTPIKSLMTDYFEPLIETVEKADPKSESDTLVLTDVKAIKAKYDVLKPLAESDTSTIGSLKTAAYALHDARYDAYRNYPHEVDAWARGGEAGGKYKELNQAATTPTTPPTSTTPTTPTTPDTGGGTAPVIVKEEKKSWFQKILGFFSGWRGKKK